LFEHIAGRTERKSVAGPLATLAPRGSSVDGD
jgi:hypothetical protein